MRGLRSVARVGVVRVMGAVLWAVVTGSTAPAAMRCTGDCNADAVVSVGELVGGVRVALDLSPLTACEAFDADRNGRMALDELVAGVQHALDGCPLNVVGEKAFFDTLYGRRDRAEETITLLERAVGADPTDGRAYFLLGMTHLLRLSQEQTDIENPSAFALEEIARANAALDAAVPLAIEDTRIPGFRAAATYVRGTMLDDEELQALGLTQLREAFDVNPLFNTFDFIGTIPAIVRPDDPLMAEALEYLEYALSPEGLERCTPQICLNKGKAPHNIEGTFLLFGDLFAKAGDRDRALIYYGFSANVAAGSGWRFVETGQERLATIDERIAAYQDEDPANDPAILGRIGTNSCAYCHYK